MGNSKNLEDRAKSHIYLAVSSIEFYDILEANDNLTDEECEQLADMIRSAKITITFSEKED